MGKLVSWMGLLYVKPPPLAGLEVATIRRRSVCRMKEGLPLSAASASAPSCSQEQQRGGVCHERTELCQLVPEPVDRYFVPEKTSKLAPALATYGLSAPHHVHPDCASNPQYSIPGISSASFEMAY